MRGGFHLLNLKQHIVISTETTELIRFHFLIFNVVIDNQMGKQVKKKASDDNVFAMKGFTVTVLFDYLPSGHGFVPASMRHLHKKKVNLPTFNADRTAYTPAFRLPSDELDLEHYLQKHAAKKQQYETISEPNIMMPRPKDKRYCHVCDQRFQDYQQHIDSEKHKQVLKEDKFQHRIERLCRKVSKHQQHQRPKTIRTTTQSDREESFTVNKEHSILEVNAVNV